MIASSNREKSDETHPDYPVVTQRVEIGACLMRSGEFGQGLCERFACDREW